MQALEQFEQTVDVSRDPLHFELRQALSVVDLGFVGEFPAQEAPLRKPIPSMLCSSVCYYRLLDVLYSIHSQRASYRNPQYSRMASIGVLKSSVRHRFRLYSTQVFLTDP